MTRVRRTLGYLILASLWAAGCGPRAGSEGVNGKASEHAGRSGLNVLVVSFDALRADHLGFHGYPRPVSPAMDRFAAASLVFDDAWAASSSTPSSFAAAFTGRLPTEVFRGWSLVESVTLAEHFAAAGYATAFVTNNSQLAPSRGFDRGFHHYDLVPDPATGEDDVGRLALDLEILRRARGLLRATDRPFFVWVHFLSPHAPYEYHAGASHLYDEEYSGSFTDTSGNTFAVSDGTDLDRLVDLYDGEVLFADELFSELLEELEDQGLDDDTLVVLTADHGEELGDHGGLQHHGVHQEVLWIPLVVQHPDWGREGSRSVAPASHLDLAPTLAAATGLPPFSSSSGVSLLDPVDSDRLRIGVSMTHRSDHFVAAARGSAKLVVSCRERTAELFDLASDPGETLDLAAERPRRQRSLWADLLSALGGEPCLVLSQAHRGVDPTHSLSEGQAAQLRALGYLGGGPTEPGPRAASAPGRIWAAPNPIVDCSGLGVGKTTIHWKVESDVDVVEIKVLPDNRLFARGGPAGESPTGEWVRDGTAFVAVEPSSGSVLAVTRASLTREGCP